jgi:hypothetical protein
MRSPVPGLHDAGADCLTLDALNGGESRVFQGICSLSSGRQQETGGDSIANTVSLSCASQQVLVPRKLGAYSTHAVWNSGSEALPDGDQSACWLGVSIFSHLSLISYTGRCVHLYSPYLGLAFPQAALRYQTSNAIIDTAIPSPLSLLQS